jgi:hypothetical protein
MTVGASRPRQRWIFGHHHHWVKTATLTRRWTVALEAKTTWKRRRRRARQEDFGQWMLQLQPRRHH